jgi:hypothetical protein
MLDVRKVAAAVAAVVVCLVAAPQARATGTILIQRSNGDAKTYPGIEIKALSGTLFLTSNDGHGTIVVNRAACSFQGKVMVCLPTSIVLVQDGESSPLALKSGTVYLNDTDQDQPLALSSQKIKAHSVMVAFTTKAGTHVNVVGQFDQVIHQ